jgi:hypothetical protein
MLEDCEEPELMFNVREDVREDVKEDVKEDCVWIRAKMLLQCEGV